METGGGDGSETGPVTKKKEKQSTENNNHRHVMLYISHLFAIMYRNNKCYAEIK